MEIMIGVVCLLAGMIIGSIFCICLVKWAFEYEKKLFELIVTDETHDPVVYTPDRVVNNMYMDKIFDKNTDAQGVIIDEIQHEES